MPRRQPKPSRAVPSVKPPGHPAELRRALTRRKKAELVDVLMELAEADRGVLRRLTARFDVAATADETGRRDAPGDRRRDHVRQAGHQRIRSARAALDARVRRTRAGTALVRPGVLDPPRTDSVRRLTCALRVQNDALGNPRGGVPCESTSRVDTIGSPQLDTRSVASRRGPSSAANPLPASARGSQPQCRALVR